GGGRAGGEDAKDTDGARRAAGGVCVLERARRGSSDRALRRRGTVARQGGRARAGCDSRRRGAPACADDLSARGPAATWRYLSGTVHAPFHWRARHPAIAAPARTEVSAPGH